MSIHSLHHPPPLTSPHPPSIPLIQVSHLPSASSFYASLTQPLSIRYLSASTTYPATLTFGLPNHPLFALTQSPYAHPNLQLQSIYLPASTPKQVADFYSKCRLLNPNCRETGIVESEVEGGRKAITRDLDGNILEAVYLPPGMGMAPAGGEGMVGATEKEARRVLMWQKEVAKSTVSGSSAGNEQEGERKQVRRADTLPAGIGAGVGGGGMPIRLIRRETVTEHYTTSPSSESPSQQGGSGGAFGGNGKAILGTILGAAAGAAVAYAMTRSEAPSSSSHVPVGVYPHPSSMAGGKPSLGRSATYSHPIPIQMQDQQQEYGVVYGSDPYHPHHQQQSQHIPTIEVGRSGSGRSHVSIREPRHVRYAIQPAPTPPPAGGQAGEERMIESKSRVGSRVDREERDGGSRVSVRSKASQRSRSEYPPDSSARSRVSMRERGQDGGDDGGSNVSSRSKSKSGGGGKSQSGRARSHVSRRDVVEVEVEEDAPRRSSSRVKHSKHGHERRERERDDDEVSESFTSARSHASSSTAKPLNRHKSTGSRVSVTIVGRDTHVNLDRDRDGGREHVVSVGERDRERTPRSHVSARSAAPPHSVISSRSSREVRETREAWDIPLPASVAGAGRFGGGGASYVGKGVRGRDGGDSDEDGEGGYGGLRRARGGDGGDGGWDEGSVAPSDSVSSVGVKRERERLRGRMGY